MRSGLVGRDAELATLTGAVEDTEAGSGRVVLLSGEAGIGKSRLAAETLAVARERGFTTLEGRANPLHSGLAYAPIVEAFRRYLAALPDDDFGTLLHGLGDLGRLLADPRLPAAAPLGDPELERTRMFDAAVQLLHRIADRQPLLLHLDDLHWADLGTIELAHYLGQGLSGRRALLLATYRTGEVDGPLRDLAVTVRRNDRDLELRLAPLTDAAVAELVRELLSADPAPELLHSVTARSRGVPLFVTALLSGRPSVRPDDLPVIIRDVVLGLLQELDQPQRRLLELASVAGDQASDQVLRAVWELADGQFQPALRRLFGTGLLTEHVGRTLTYRVGHPLYAEVAYAELTATERRGVHAALATAIDRHDPEDVLALAPHYLGAGDLVDPGRASAVLADAGWRALAVHADEEAVRYLSAAVAEARAGRREDLLATLLEGLGLAHQRGGQLDTAVATWNEALAIAGRTGADEVAGTLRIRLALGETERGNPALAKAHAELGAPVLPAMGIEAAVLRVVFAIRRFDAVELRATATELADIASAEPSQVGRSSAELARAMLGMLDNDFVAARQAAQRAAAAGELCVEEAPILAAVACRWLIGLSALAGDLAAALSYARLHASGVLKIEHPAAPSSAQYNLAIAHYLRGDLAAAVAAVDIGLARSRRAKLPRSQHHLLLGRAFLLAEQGNVAEAKRCLTEAQDVGISPDVALGVLAELAETALAIHAGEPDRVPARAGWQLFYEPMVISLAMLTGGLGALAAGDRDRAARIAGQLRDAGRTAVLLDALADRLDGLVAADPTLLNAAADRLAAMGMSLLAAQSRLEWAELVGGDAVTGAVSECLEVFERAGVIPWVDRCRRLARSVGIRVTSGRASGVLSKREAQVVRLVADGLSNADIAGRLFLSERTIETHLRNSYAKLGLGSRVALARWVTESGDD